MNLKKKMDTASKVYKDSKYIWFGGLFLLSLTIRSCLLEYYSYLKVIEADGAGYVGGAKAFLDGFDISKISIIDHPIFPILIAFFSYIAPDWEMAGRMVTMVGGSFIAPLVFLVSEAKGNSFKVSVFAGLFIAVSPFFVGTSFQVFNDSLNCAFLLTGFWQLIVATKNNKTINYFFSGIGFALAYLTRPDSIVPSFFAVLAVIYWSLRFGLSKGGWRHLLVFLVGFAILAIPYILFLHAHLGAWVISGRQAVAQRDTAAVIAGNYEEFNYGLKSDLTLGLGGDIKTLVASGGADIKRGLLQMWVDDPGKMLSSLLKNLKIEWDVFVNGVPWYIKALALFAFILEGRRFVTNNGIFIVYISPLFFLYPFFWADARHIFHYMLPLWLWASEGIEALVKTIQRTNIGGRLLSKGSYSKLFEYSIYLLLLVVFAFSFEPKTIGLKDLNYLRQKEMGVWISKNTPKDSVVMARWPRLFFYTERKTVMFPYAEWELMKKYMKKNGVTHLVVDESFFGMRPQIRHLLTPIITGSSLSPDDSLSIIRIKRDQFGGMIVYEVKK